MKGETTFSLKDQLFNSTKVDLLANWVQAVHPPFRRSPFRAAVMAALPSLELKQRISHIAASLHEHLPKRYDDSLSILLDALPPELDASRTDNDFGDFIIAPVALFVAMYGCTHEHLNISLQALREITKRFSAEDAVRYFLNAFPQETLDFLQTCATDENYHVRRLASEGTRPFLPWSQRVTVDYHAPVAILDTLFRDRTRYVTRSVANHLNDISKIDPDLVLATLGRWRESGAQTGPEMDFITRHALRSLVKTGHSGALEVLGFGGEADITVTNLITSTPRVRVGAAFRFSFTVRAGQRRQRLLIDYVMTFAGEGRKSGRKVFKLTRLDLAAGESASVSKAHPMRLMTTRRLHAGEHLITLQVNGRPHGTLAFELTAV